MSVQIVIFTFEILLNKKLEDSFFIGIFSQTMKQRRLIYVAAVWSPTTHRSIG